MGRKSKEEIAHEERKKKIAEVHKLLEQLFQPGETFENEDILDELGFQCCRDCEAIGYHLGECEVCSDCFCVE